MVKDPCNIFADFHFNGMDLHSQLSSWLVSLTQNGCTAKGEADDAFEQTCCRWTRI